MLGRKRGLPVQDQILPACSGFQSEFSIVLGRGEAAAVAGVQNTAFFPAARPLEMASSR